MVQTVHEDNFQRGLQPELAQSESEEEEADQVDPEFNSSRPNSHLHFDNSEDESDQDAMESSEDEAEEESASQED